MPTQARSPVLAQDTPDPTIECLNWRSTSPGVHEDVFIQPSISLDVTETPLSSVEVHLGVSALGSLIDIQHDSSLSHSELEVEFGCGSGTTSGTVTRSISELFYVIAFSHLSGPRCASPSVAPNNAGFQVYTPFAGEIGPPAFCADDSPDVDSPVFTEPVSATFVRPVSPLPPSSPGFINDYSGADDITIPLFPLPSSPVPSSSPPNFFTSSPARHPLHKSPPTSPAPEKPIAVPSSVDPKPSKRPHNSDTMAIPAGDRGGFLGEGTPKKRVRYTRYGQTCGTHAAPRG